MSSSGALPFWATAGQWGLMPENNGTLSLIQAKTQFDDTKSFQWRWGASFAANYYNNSLSSAASSAHFMVDELYASIKWKALKLDLGQKRRDLDFMATDPLLGSLSVTGGHIVESGNARTMPGWIGTLEPVAIPLTNRHLYVYGAFGDYKTIDNRYINNTLVHRTRIGLRGDICSFLRLHFMLDHIAMWGGDRAGDLPGDVKMPITLGNYFRVITGSPAGSDGSSSDQINVIGNQLGSELFKIEFLGEGWSIVAQHDIPYDDKSGMRFQNFPDGANILSFSFNNKNRWVSDVLFEHHYTIWQSGTTHDIPTTEDERKNLDPNDQYHYWRHLIGGGDDYFNHLGGYSSGWTHFGKCIGNPLFYSRGTKNRTWTSDQVTMGLENTRLSAFHIGVSGKLDCRHPYRFMMTYSSNYGTYSEPYLGESIWGTNYTRSEMVEAMKAAGEYPLGQFSASFCGIIDKLFEVDGLQAMYGIYGDYGDVLPKSIGACLGVRFVFDKLSMVL